MVKMETESVLNNNEEGNESSDCKWKMGHCNFQNAMDDSAFNAAASTENVKIFARRIKGEGSTGSPFTSQDLLDALSAKKVSRTSLLSRIEYNPVENELSLVTDTSNIRSRYGYDVGKQAYVYPEEALFLLECGKAEIFCNYLSLSVQRARSLLLMPHKDDKDKDGNGKNKFCASDEYLVYKCLTRMGYCVYRCKPRGEISQHAEEAEELGQMETDDDVIAIDESQRSGENYFEAQEDVVEVGGGNTQEASCNSRKFLKRKHSEDDLYEDEESSCSDEIMDGYPAFQASSFLVNVDGSHFPNETSGYTVDEADSDVEIVDEVIFSHGGVEIQEIAHSTGCHDEYMEMSDEPVPSTSKGPKVSKVVVDLVSSEDEDEDSKEFGRKVWSKFVPNSKVFFQMPPGKLIPKSVPSSDNVYEFDLKDKSDISDLELEFLVDEVSLNDDKFDMCSSDSSHINLANVKSWKEWRQNIFQEARNVMNNSLLASSECINGEAATEKLFLWGENRKEGEAPASIISKIVYEMYGPIMHGYSRQKAFEGKPLYYVLISRQDEPVPDFGLFGSSINGIPILIAIVCDSGENDVLFMTADRSPLNSLF